MKPITLLAFMHASLLITIPYVLLRIMAWRLLDNKVWQEEITPDKLAMARPQIIIWMIMYCVAGVGLYCALVNTKQWMLAAALVCGIVNLCFCVLGLLLPPRTTISDCIEQNKTEWIVLLIIVVMGTVDVLPVASAYINVINAEKQVMKLEYHGINAYHCMNLGEKFTEQPWKPDARACLLESSKNIKDYIDAKIMSDIS
jgi:hypothetical protein